MSAGQGELLGPRATTDAGLPASKVSTSRKPVMLRRQGNADRQASDRSRQPDAGRRRRCRSAPARPRIAAAPCRSRSCRAPGSRASARDGPRRARRAECPNGDAQRQPDQIRAPASRGSRSHRSDATLWPVVNGRAEIEVAGVRDAWTNCSGSGSARPELGADLRRASASRRLGRGIELGRIAVRARAPRRSARRGPAKR